MEHMEWMYTDETGDKHPCRINDKMPGKGGYIGIIYWNNGIEEFAFVELDSLEKI